MGNDNGKGTQNNFPGASKKTDSSKDFKIDVSSTENRRVRANILNKYQKDKTLVSSSNSKSDENSWDEWTLQSSYPLILRVYKTGYAIFTFQFNQLHEKFYKRNKN